MQEQIDKLITELETAGNLTQMVAQEDAIAQLTGSGFMEGQIGYFEMEVIQGDVAEIESGLREKFDNQTLRSQNQALVPQMNSRSGNTR